MEQQKDINDIVNNIEDEEDPFTEMALLIKIEQKFSKLENWTKFKCKEIKREMFELVDGIEIKGENKKYK